MDLKKEIENYFNKNTRKRKKYYMIMKEFFWGYLEKEIKILEIDDNWNIDRKIWHFIKGTNEIPKCNICGINNSRWQYYKHDYGYCSLSCSSAQSMKRILEKNGGLNPFQLDYVKEKSKNTLLNKYGVTNISKLDYIKERKENTMLKNYGRKTNLGNNEEFMLNKYGVKNASHLPEIAEKILNNRYKKRHLIITPSGKKIFLQGYESKGYNILLEEGFDENDILHKKIDMPVIMYNYNGKEKRYYPDFFIKKENIVIEVKCNYTYEIEKEKNDAKFYATKNNGYTHRLLIIN